MKMQKFIKMHATIQIEIWYVHQETTWLDNFLMSQLSWLEHGINAATTGGMIVTVAYMHSKNQAAIQSNK